jgi:ABC-type transport system involved in cytochrome bd biosynthesis fused ATPase/permease subunit
MIDHQPAPERPRVEPEIIPPDRNRSQSGWRRSDWPGPFTQRRGTDTDHVYVARLGPFGVALLMFALAAIAAVFLIAVLGAVLIWIPVVAVLIVVAAFLRFLRR